MKTYSRKKASDIQEEEVIVDLNELCRLCMNKENELVSIFAKDDPIPLTLRILSCVSLEILEGDGLPNKICHPCKFQISTFFNFRKKCESTDSKLRHLVKDFSKEDDNEIEYEDEDQEMEETVQEPNDPETPQSKSQSTSENSNAKGEDDLMGIGQVTYIQPPDENDDPENITLPSEVEFINKNACTLEGSEQKKGVEEDNTENNSNIFIIDNENQQGLDDNNLDAIADAVKATLASQPELKLSGQIQLKVNNSEGKSTQVEITTEDGSVIIMELMTEDAPEIIPPSIPEEKKNDDGELEIFKCPNCPKSFSRRIQLRRHESVHMQQRGFSCGICEKWFPTKSALTRHERIHTGERPFQCEVCQKSFAQKEILFRHLMTHTGQKPYNCPHCPKGFTQKEPLRVHLRSHVVTDESDIQLHYCSLCPKIFCHASGLSRHLVTHTGKTFKCQECDKTFTDKSSLKRHHRQTGHMG
ncbi:zinc finger protein 2-like [Harmonia axyridis]|uniref:zinc finger protein 2-like n=1 Tax=Harmonia axyridis TaxID=115357 RepID=UPI001E2789F9|nr:zinc finger protein 2-like [Harmonia axyridis]